jgi:hypothetical protein
VVGAQEVPLFLELAALEQAVKATLVEAEYLMMQLTEKVEAVAGQVPLEQMELFQELALVVLEQHLQFPVRQ